tara:strand:+ start:898 stop:1212 length:315 start_codon:yes stop_codon:yes gene_type:complete
MVINNVRYSKSNVICTYYFRYLNDVGHFKCLQIQLYFGKKTNQLNILASEIDPSIPMAKVYYFKELNCNNVNVSWDYERVMKNLKVISVAIYQELSTDIRGKPN